MWVFEILCAIVVLLALAIYVRSTRTSASRLARRYLALAFLGWAGEQAFITLYHHYGYSPDWSIFVGDVPLMIPLIWPLVILSAMQVADSLFPAAPRPLVVAAVVLVDASMVETIASHAELWWWREPGYLGVPLIGLLGWSLFAAGAAWAMDETRAGGQPLDLCVAPLVSHLGVILAWWLGLRWFGRAPLEPLSLWVGTALSLMAAAAVLWARREGRALGLDQVLGRLLATAVFLLLLVLHPPHVELLWHLGIVALPYLLATRWRPTQTWRHEKRAPEGALSADPTR